MFEKLSNNLNILMEEARISAEELGRRTGLPASTIKKIRNHDNPNPTLATLSPLAHYFTLTLSQLIGDEPFPTTRIAGVYQPSETYLFRIPLIAWEESIAWSNDGRSTRAFVSTEHQYGQHAFALMVESDQWENLSKGTALLVDPAMPAEAHDYVLVLKTGDARPMLYQLLVEANQSYLKSLEKRGVTELLTSQYVILGVVVEYKKHLKVKQDQCEVMA